MKLLAHSLLMCFLFLSAFADMIKDEAWVRKYFTQLKKTYDKRVFPVAPDGSDSPVKVFITMYILDISKVDDSNMDYTAQFYFRQQWNDSRLSFTDKSDVIKLSTEEDIWTPDLFFTTGRESRLEAIVHPNKMIRIHPSGQVFYSIRVTVKFACPMDLHYFPHDTQKCRIRAESYAHVKKEIDVYWGEGVRSIEYNKNITLFNFDIITVDNRELIENLTFGVYKVLEVDVTLQRKFGYFAIKVYVPFIILVSLSLISLWIGAEERSIRFLLLITILYLMTNIASEINDNIPAAPYTKGTDVWIGFCESLVFAIFLEFIVVALISRRHTDSIGEVLLNMESESKEQSVKSESRKSHLCKLVNMFNSRNGGKAKRNETAYRIDKIFRIVFPLIFFLFNVVYWSAYCGK